MQKNQKKTVAKPPSYSSEWIALVDRMSQLVDESKMIQPSYFYLELQRRADRMSINLRWRARGQNGSSLVFTDARMQEILASLPVAMQRKYVSWEQQKVELNQQAKQLRMLLARRMNQQIKQFELQV